MSLEIRNLSKTYPNDVKAMDSVSLSIGKGMFGLLGPNGAGRSTLMRTLATLQYPDRGTVSYNNKSIFDNVTEFRSVLGYLPQDFGVYPGRSAVDLLNYLGVLKGLTGKTEREEIIHEVLHLTNLSEAAHQAVSSFSGGMKQRFGIAQLLLNRPEIMIVDEPTAGLDPAERKRFLNILRELGSQNIVIFSTHIVEDVRDLCNDLAIIHQGSILSQIPPSEALKRIHQKVWVKTYLSGTQPPPGSEPSAHILSDRFSNQGHYEVRVFSDHRPGPDFMPAGATLEDFYFVTIKGLLP
jgi:ABC-type multidrug transport system ATPase subunit